MSKKLSAEKQLNQSAAHSLPIHSPLTRKALFIGTFISLHLYVTWCGTVKRVIGVITLREWERAKHNEDEQRRMSTGRKQRIAGGSIRLDPLSCLSVGWKSQGGLWEILRAVSKTNVRVVKHCSGTMSTCGARALPYTDEKKRLCQDHGKHIAIGRDRIRYGRRIS